MTLTKTWTLVLSKEGRAPGDAHWGFAATGWPGMLGELTISAANPVPLESQHFPQSDDTMEMGFTRFGEDHFSSTKSFFNRTHLWYQKQSQHYLISALFLIWLVTHYEHHTIFSWTWQFWGLISHCPKQTPPPVHSSWLYSYHNWIIPEQSLRYCHPVHPDF